MHVHISTIISENNSLTANFKFQMTFLHFVFDSRLTSPCKQNPWNPTLYFKSRVYKVGQYIYYYNSKNSSWLLRTVSEGILSSMPQSMFGARIRKISLQKYHRKNVLVGAMKEGYILHGFVNSMWHSLSKIKRNWYTWFICCQFFKGRHCDILFDFLYTVLL